MKCPDCGERVRREAGSRPYNDEYACTVCAWRSTDAPKGGNSVTTERSTADPFEQIVEAVRQALEIIGRRVATLADEQTKRREQLRRLSSAQAALTGAKMVVRTGAKFGAKPCKVCGNHPLSKAHKEACGPKVAA